MSMYMCDICKKEFKTTQHLNQHKNRKKICTLSNKHLNEVVTLPTKTASDDLNITEIMSFIKTAEGIQTLINDKKIIEDYKNTITNLKKENEALKAQIKNIQQIIQSSFTKNSEPTIADINNNDNNNNKNINENNDSNLTKNNLC